MNTLKIFCDLSVDDATWELMTGGVAPHEIIRPARPAVSVLAQSGADPALAHADIAFGQPDARAVLDASRLRWLQISSAGYTRYDTVDFRKAAVARGLVVTNSSTVYAEPCAEHVASFMLSQARQLPATLRARCANDSPGWLELRQSSTLLRNQNVLLVGFGSIAHLLVEILKPFGMKIVALRHRPKGDESVPIITEERLASVLAVADHVVNILPESSETARFFSAERFAAMKKGAVFYNIGRGKTVDQDALLTALRSGRLAAAWLDVTEPEPLPAGHPLLSVPNCHITPHTGGGHHNESETLVRHFVENFSRYIEGAPLRDRIM